MKLRGNIWPSGWGGGGGGGGACPCEYTGAVLRTRRVAVFLGFPPISDGPATVRPGGKINPSETSPSPPPGTLTTTTTTG